MTILTYGESIMGSPLQGIAMPGGESRGCKCGYVHPPPWDDNCPMVQSSSIENNEKTQSITKFCQSLATFLHSRDDYARIIDAFTKRLNF